MLQADHVVTIMHTNQTESNHQNRPWRALQEDDDYVPGEAEDGASKKSAKRKKGGFLGQFMQHHHLCVCFETFGRIYAWRNPLLSFSNVTSPRRHCRRQLKGSRRRGGGAGLQAG